MTTTEDTESTEEVRVEGQKLKVASQRKGALQYGDDVATIPPLRAAKGAALRSGRQTNNKWTQDRDGRTGFEIEGERLYTRRVMSLFPTMPEMSGETPAALQPLAERMRPRTLDEFIGQEKLLGPGKPLRVQIETDNLSSMLFWGPPGCGKTTLAKVIARLTRSEFVSFSAVLSGIKEIKEVMAEAERRSRGGHRTIVFVDEVHRFNKAQQDAFLPHVEAGHILFIGATTENPSFEVISPLLSRT